MARVMSVRLNEELAARLERLAASLDRPKAWVIEQAIARYVEQEAWQVDAIAEALAEYREGNASVRPHGEVMGGLEARYESISATRVLRAETGQHAGLHDASLHA